MFFGFVFVFRSSRLRLIDKYFTMLSTFHLFTSARWRTSTFLFCSSAAFADPAGSRSSPSRALVCFCTLLCHVGGPCVSVHCSSPTDVSDVVYLALLLLLTLRVSLTRGGVKS